MPARHCPALLIAAAASGQGKTTVTAALARHHRNRGLRVHVFKAGPDFLDPMIHRQASGHEVQSLDLWITGEADARRRLYEAAGQTDLILVEGVMGLFDGHPSSADIAARFGIPVMLVIDGSAMAQTFGALAQGLAGFRSDLRVAGVFANRVSGARHFELLAEYLPASLTAFGYLPRAADMALPSRHLGLVQAQEIEDLERRLEAAASQLVWKPAGLPPAVAFHDDPAPVPEAAQGQTDPGCGEELPLEFAGQSCRPLAGRRIAIARDAAFAFIYPANLELLTRLGAELCFFSPLAGEGLPRADAVYLPGGYPELHLEALAGNASLKRGLADHVAARRPLLAECGGMLYLLERLEDAQGQGAPMAGLLPGSARMQGRLAGLGPQEVRLPEGLFRGHSFHHSAMQTPMEPCGFAESPIGRPTREPVYRLGSITATYVHLYFPSNPAGIARLFGGRVEAADTADSPAAMAQAPGPCG